MARLLGSGIVLKSLPASMACEEKTRLECGCGVDGAEGATSADVRGNSAFKADFEGVDGGFGEALLRMLESDRLCPKRPVLDDIW